MIEHTLPRTLLPAILSCLSGLLAGCGAPAPPDAAPPATVAARTEALLPELGRNVRVNGDRTARAQNDATVGWSLAHPDRLLAGAHSFPLGATQLLGAELAYYVSFDGGRSFPVQGELPGLTTRHGGTYEGASEPTLACGPDGRCYYASFLYELGASRTAIAVSRLAEDGRGFSAPAFVTQSADPHLFQSRPAIAVDGSPGGSGAVYVTWTRVHIDDDGQVDAAAILCARSLDRGLSFGAPVQVSPPRLDFNQGSQVAVGPDGAVVVAYENYLDQDYNQHVVQRSTDGGVRFGAPVRATDVWDAFAPLPPARYRLSSEPSLAVDPLRGALYLAWLDLRGGGPDVLIVSSLDGGRSFSGPARVNSTPAGAAIPHAFPKVACGPLGLCGVAFYSGRVAPASGRLDGYYAPVLALRGGPAAGRDRRVSVVSLDPEAQLGGAYIGIQVGLALDWTTAHPAWTDTRLALPDGAGAVGPQQDIFTARVGIF